MAKKVIKDQEKTLKEEKTAAAPKPAAKKASAKAVKAKVKPAAVTEPVADTKPAATPEPVATPEPAPTPKPAAVTKSATLSMADLLNKKDIKLMVPKRNDTVTGVITYKDKKSIRIDIGAKTEGVVADKEFDFATDYIEDLKVGDKIEAIVISSDNDRGQVVLSLKGSANEAKWDYFKQMLDKEEVLDAKGIEVNKGGLIVLVNGVRGFVPASQFGRQYVGQIKNLKSQTFQVRAIEVDQEKNRLIFSERHVSEAKQLAQKDQALKMVKEGAIYEGVVSGVMPFGLFMTVEVPIAAATTAAAKVEVAAKTKKATKVTKAEAEKAADTTNVVATGTDTVAATDVATAAAADTSAIEVGYVEGLIHISEISWEKVNHPKDYHKVGDHFKVKVLGVDEKTGKLNLSIKQLVEDPWLSIAKKYPEGTSFNGKVSRIEPFGVFINVEPGVDGLIHSTKLDPNRSLQVGEEVIVNVENVDVDNRRMSLSLVLTEVPIGYK